MTTEPQQRHLDRMTLEQLREELGKARELLMGIGAEYYTLALLKEGNLATTLPVPTEWARQCHELMEGNTLSDEVLAQLQSDDPEQIYMGHFFDREGHAWLFLYDKKSYHARIHTNSYHRDPLKMPSEVKTWYAAVHEACRMGPVPIPPIQDIKLLEQPELELTPTPAIEKL